MKIASVFLSLCAAALLVTGCAKNQMPAKKAVDQIEDSLKDVRADAEHYAPDGLKGVESGLKRLKADYDAKNYDEVMAAQPQLAKAVDSLKAAVATGKQHAQEAVKVARSEWEALNSEVPKMVETIDKRVAELDKKKHFKGVKQEVIDTAKSQFDTMKSLWAEASQEAKSGKPVAAANKGKTAKSMGDEIYEKLEIKKT
jgi:alanyl-tRNA synthetase